MKRELICVNDTGGNLGQFAGDVPLVSQNPYPILVYSWSILWPIIVLSHFRANDLTLEVVKKCDPILVTILHFSGIIKIMPKKATPL